MKKLTKKYIVLKKIDYEGILSAIMLYPLSILIGIMFFIITLIPFYGIYFIHTEIDKNENPFIKYERMEVKEE